jgi:hypothetical protein
MTALAATCRITDGHDVTATSSIDRVIRISTAVAVLAVAGVAAYVSYWHAYAVVRAHGGSGITARLEPATIDGLVYASFMVVLYAARHRLPVPGWNSDPLGLLPGLRTPAGRTCTAHARAGDGHQALARSYTPGIITPDLLPQAHSQCDLVPHNRPGHDPVTRLRERRSPW